LVFRNGGTLDKYMGDAIMCFFGAPVEQKDHALRACRTALQMIDQLESLREWWRAEGRPEIDIGIGINSGSMVVGNMGSDMRFDYTVMGDSVNLASRLEGINKEYGTRIVLSEFTLELVKDEVAVRELGAVRVKGKKKPVKIYELLAMGPAPEAAQPFLEAFARGLSLRFPDRRFTEAALAFREALALRPEDVSSHKYLAECEAYASEPPPPGWDGVLEMKTK
jgi:adenylate cyclase